MHIKRIHNRPALDAVCESLKKRVDVAAEQERQKYITDGVGQSMTYTEKFNQAVDFSKKYTMHKAAPDQNPEPNENDYLLLKAGLGIDGSTLIEVAATVTYAYAVWQQIGAAIEGVRLQAKWQFQRPRRLKKHRQYLLPSNGLKRKSRTTLPRLHKSITSRLQKQESWILS